MHFSMCFCSAFLHVLDASACIMYFFARGDLLLNKKKSKNRPKLLQENMYNNFSFAFHAHYAAQKEAPALFKNHNCTMLH